MDTNDQLSSAPEPLRPPNDDLIEIARVKSTGLLKLDMNNSKHYRTCWALQESIETLLDLTPIANVAHIILTTTECHAQNANKKLGRITEFLGRSGIKWVRFFDRLDSGEVHWHILAALPFPVVANYHCGQSACIITKQLFPWEWERAINRELTESARRLKRNLKDKLRDAGYGGIVKIQPLVFPDKIGDYLSKWVKGSARRFRGDKNVRLFSASKELRVPTTGFHFVTPWFRVARVKMAAYCQRQGWSSFAAASAADPRWGFHSRKVLEKIIAGLYVTEEDFAADCGIEFSPELLGVSILMTNADAGLAPVDYLHTMRPKDPVLLDRLEKSRRRVMPLSREQWENGGRK